MLFTKLFLTGSVRWQAEWQGASGRVMLGHLFESPHGKPQLLANTARTAKSCQNMASAAKKRARTQKDEVEHRLQEACKYLQSNVHKSYSSATKAFEVNYHTVKSRLITHDIWSPDHITRGLWPTDMTYTQWPTPWLHQQTLSYLILSSFLN